PDKPLPPGLSEHLVKDIPFVKSNNRFTSQSGLFVPIILEEKLTITFKISTSGKVRKRLNPCKVKSPALPGEYDSLNSILQKISGLYEPDRDASGGKVYDYLFFKDDSDGKWKPLEILRERLFLPVAPEFKPWDWGVPITSKDHPLFNRILANYEKALEE